MKKLIFILLILATSLQAGPYMGAEFGKNLEEYYGEKIQFISLYGGYRFNTWEIQHQPYFDYRNWYVSNGTVGGGEPFKDIYTIGYKLKYKHFFVRYEHFCNHYVSSGRANDQRPLWTNNKWGEDMTTVSAGFEIEIK